jgi:hypothetical protein
MVSIECRVLQRLCHQRSRELLDLEREMAVTRNTMSRAARSDEIQGQRIAQKIENTDVGAEPIRACLGECGIDDGTIFAAGPEGVRYVR